MKGLSALTAGIVVLAIAWTGPLAGTAATSFSARMLTHMLVVAIASPFLAFYLKPVLQTYASVSMISMAAFVFSLVDLVIIWTWHLPVLHDYARYEGAVLIAEQMSFLIVGVLVWVSALASCQTAQPFAALAGAGALFFTSMHMTLLGTLLTLAPRPLYSSCLEGPRSFNISAQEDQQLGGVIMLGMGGLIYLVAGVVVAGVAIAGATDNYTQRKGGK